MEAIAQCSLPKEAILGRQARRIIACLKIDLRYWDYHWRSGNRRAIINYLHDMMNK
ncbi:MAG: hypothetical protein LBP92_11590 [Deltaproteobacteria bacterium]|jgi:hypothetical protein|nr:hypothetical protein [Deltaproteobacteria bacterium]